MIINRLQQQLRGGGKEESSEWMNKVPVMVEMLESLLYNSASSLEEYRDESTLKERVYLISADLLQIKRHSGEDCSMMGDLEEQLKLFSF